MTEPVHLSRDSIDIALRALRLAQQLSHEKAGECFADTSLWEAWQRSNRRVRQAIAELEAAAMSTSPSPARGTQP